MTSTKSPLAKRNDRRAGSRTPVSCRHRSHHDYVGPVTSLVAPIMLSVWRADGEVSGARARRFGGERSLRRGDYDEPGGGLRRRRPCPMRSRPGAPCQFRDGSPSVAGRYWSAAAQPGTSDVACWWSPTPRRCRSTNSASARRCRGSFAISVCPRHFSGRFASGAERADMPNGRRITFPALGLAGELDLRHFPD
jgi:hypothetical protein